MPHDFDFDAPIDRVGTHCEKFDARAARFGDPSVIPLWVADMDFAAPPAVERALSERARHPIYGYSKAHDGLSDALCGWFERRHRWVIDPATVLWTPGTMPALIAAMRAYTEAGDRVIVPTPVYPPFLSSVERNGRTLVTSELQRGDGGYSLDFNRIEAQAKAGAKLLLLCSPHNPVGRVWSRDTLVRLIEIAVTHGVAIVSDEVHADFVFPEAEHTVLARLAPPELRLTTTVSPAKTFNIPGLGFTAAVVSHDADRRAMREVFERLHVAPFNPFSMAAFEAAYRDGDAWLDALTVYLDENRRWLHAQVCTLDGLSMELPEATFLAWLDARGLGLADSALQRFFIEGAGLALNPGVSFGPGGEGHLRLNFGTRRSVLAQAIAQLRAALARRR